MPGIGVKPHRDGCEDLVSDELQVRNGEGRVPEPALVTRTSSELLKRPLPRILIERPVRFVLGPPGVGKTSVASRVAGPDALVAGMEGVRKALVSVARTRKWSEEMLNAPVLLLDGVDCLHGRFGAVEFLGKLLSQRLERGLITVLCQGQADTSVTMLYDLVPHTLQATVLVRFPVGGGRKKHVMGRCDALGIDYQSARPWIEQAIALEPWNYTGVEKLLLQAIKP